jgi:hypothetical protein
MAPTSTHRTRALSRNTASAPARYGLVRADGLWWYALFAALRPRIGLEYPQTAHDGPAVVRCVWSRRASRLQHARGSTHPAARAPWWVIDPAANPRCCDLLEVGTGPTLRSNFPEAFYSSCCISIRSACMLCCRLCVTRRGRHHYPRWDPSYAANWMRASENHPSTHSGE